MKRYEPIRKFIHLTDKRNTVLSVTNLVGLTIEKRYIPSVANVIGTDLSKYKVIKQGQFACSLMQVSRDGKMPVAMYKGEPSIMSPAYPIFEVNDENELMPEYLHMYLSRPEFDREAVFRAVGGVRGSLDWEDFLDMKMPIPSIEEQRKIVAEYQAVEQRIENNNRLIKALEDTAQAIYHHTFVENIDPENLPEGWRWGTLSDLGEIIGGATPSTDISEYWCDNGISWLSPADLSKQGTKFISKGAKDITELGYKSCSTKILPKGSVLFSSRAPIGLMAIATQDVCTNQGFKSIVPNDKFGTEYIYYYLTSIKDIIAEENVGSTFSEVSGQTMKDYKAILPSKDLIDLFTRKTKSIFNQQYLVEQENSILIKTKKLLLSKLS